MATNYVTAKPDICFAHHIIQDQPSFFKIVDRSDPSGSPLRIDVVNGFDVGSNDCGMLQVGSRMPLWVERHASPMALPHGEGTYYVMLNWEFAMPSETGGAVDSGESFGQLVCEFEIAASPPEQGNSRTSIILGCVVVEAGKISNIYQLFQNGVVRIEDRFVEVEA